ncbi:MAG: WHG domain-containing protein [Paracoccaceae bacterium]|nr:WHG domain-containing protein [Paracoccaceae bacterium]
MVGKRQEKREALRRNLIGAAAARIEEGGLSAFRARDVAADVGCALGTIYTVFQDLDDLILQVNAETLQDLGRSLAPTSDVETPKTALTALAQGYARFAAKNFNRWNALFDHRMADGGPSPDWLLAHHSTLLRLLERHIAKLTPGLAGEALTLRARTWFAAVHGIVSISLQKRFLGLPDDRLMEELEVFVGQVVAGSGR